MTIKHQMEEMIKLIPKGLMKKIAAETHLELDKEDIEQPKSKSSCLIS